jgi:acetyl esterase/lipase
VETVNQRSTDPAYSDRAMLGITRPRMVVFRPARPNGCAVVITPGGAYRWVVVDKEGYEFARWLSARGVTAFVLFYRLPAEGWARRADVALADIQRGVRLIRARASQWAIDPDRVATVGFSAGGHVCADLSARYATSMYEPVDAADRLSARPSAAAPIYPVISMAAPLAHAVSRTQLLGDSPSTADEAAHSPHLHIGANAPPHFLLHAEDDTSVPVGNTLLLRQALIDKRVPCETHLFPEGGHGFGLRLAAGKPVAVWPDLWLAWASRLGLVR